MNLGTFTDTVSEIVNESALIEPLIWSATRRAAKWIELKHSFQYMRGTGSYQFGLLPAAVTVVATIAPVGPTDIGLSNVVSNDGLIELSWDIGHDNADIRVSDYIQFDSEPTHLSSGYDILAGTFGQIKIIQHSTVRSYFTIAVPSDLGLPAAIEFQPTTFRLYRLRGNPFDTGAHDPGLISIGKRVKSIAGDILISAEDDISKVLRKVTRLGTVHTDVNDESWDSSRTGSIPAGYRLLGLAGSTTDRSLGALAVDKDDYLLVFRPIPDRAYWITASVVRFTDWPVPKSAEDFDSDFEHFLLDAGEGILLARTILELSPALRDRELGRSYAEILQNDWQTLIASDIELQESDGEDAMRYDSEHSR